MVCRDFLYQALGTETIQVLEVAMSPFQALSHRIYGMISTLPNEWNKLGLYLKHTIYYDHHDQKLNSLDAKNDILIVISPQEQE